MVVWVVVWIGDAGDKPSDLPTWYHTLNSNTRQQVLELGDHLQNLSNACFSSVIGVDNGS